MSQDESKPKDGNGHPAYEQRDRADDKRRENDARWALGLLEQIRTAMVKRCAEVEKRVGLEEATEAWNIAIGMLVAFTRGLALEGDGFAIEHVAAEHTTQFVHRAFLDRMAQEGKRPAIVLPGRPS